MLPPVQPSRGLFGFFGLAPAYCENAATTPAMSWLSNAPNAPWQSDRTATLIVVAEFLAVATDADSAAATTARTANGISFRLPVRALIRLPSSFRTDGCFLIVVSGSPTGRSLPSLLRASFQTLGSAGPTSIGFRSRGPRRRPEKRESARSHSPIM